MIQCIIKKIKNVRYNKRVTRAITQANELKKLTGYKYFVIVFKGKPLVVSKRDIKHKVATKYFKKGTTVQDVEQVALYKTL